MTELEKIEGEDVWFGMEQEYSLCTLSDKLLGWPELGLPGPQGPYYCGVGTYRRDERPSPAHSALSLAIAWVGAGNVVAREVCEAHYSACLYAGLEIDGCNAEVMPCQWEYQIGPCTGIDLADQIWVSRYILARIAETFGFKV